MITSVLVSDPVLRASVRLNNIIVGAGEKLPPLAPPFQGGGGGSGGLAQLAQTINNILIQIALFGVPVLLGAGFLMILFGGMNPQWKQRGIETIKWTLIGAIGLGIGVGVIQGFIVSAGGLGGGGGVP